MFEYKKIDVTTLSNILNVSDVTIRKDLEKLEKEGFLKKIHGGAIIKKERPIVNQINLDIHNLEGKNKIAELAFKTIEKGDSIFLGSGSTCYLLARKLKELKDITVVTNNLNALMELVPHVKNVFLLGGEIAYHNGIILSSGKKAGDYLEDIQVNQAFTSITGLDLDAGLTVNRSISSFLYETLKTAAKNWTLLVDHTKFDRVNLYKVASIDEVDCIICDKINEQYRKEILNKGKKVISSLVNN